LPSKPSNFSRAVKSSLAWWRAPVCFADKGHAQCRQDLFLVRTRLRQFRRGLQFHRILAQVCVSATRRPTEHPNVSRCEMSANPTYFMVMPSAEAKEE
jgi:hypothetical protein